MKRTSLLFGSKFAAALLAALAAGTPLFAWTEEGDRLKREAKARAEAEAREATAAWYRECRIWNEAQRLAATESICRENITRFFAVEDDAFEKCRYFYPLATSIDWLRKYDLEKKYKTSSGFFTPYARLGEDKALQCGAKVGFSLDYRLFVTSVIFLFPDGETIEIFRSDFASSNARVPARIAMHCALTASLRTRWRPSAGASLKSALMATPSATSCSIPLSRRRSRRNAAFREKK